MTPEAFAKSVTATVEWLALQLAHEPDAKVDAVLADLQERWTAGLGDVWRNVDHETLEAGALCIVVEVRKRLAALRLD